MDGKSRGATPVTVWGRVEADGTPRMPASALRSNARSVKLPDAIAARTSESRSLHTFALAGEFAAQDNNCPLGIWSATRKPRSRNLPAQASSAESGLSAFTGNPIVRVLA